MMDRVGRVKKVTVGYNRRTGQSSGYAFVEFESRRDAELAFDEFQSKDLQGRRLRVDWDEGLEKKQTRRGPRTYNGGGGGGGDRRYNDRYDDRRGGGDRYGGGGGGGVYGDAADSAKKFNAGDNKQHKPHNLYNKRLLKLKMQQYRKLRKLKMR